MWIIYTIWILFIVSLCTACITSTWRSGPSKHQRCLESISRLEPECFPELPRELRWVEWDHRAMVKAQKALYYKSEWKDTLQPRDPSLAFQEKQATIAAVLKKYDRDEGIGTEGVWR